MTKILKKRGFTLIELLVVIAIIGILSSVVLASLNTARDKGKDASAKGSLSSLRAEAELYYDDNSNKYISTGSVTCSTGLLAPGTGPKKLLDAAVAQTAGVPVCNGDSGKYAVSLPLKKTGVSFCVDSAGFAGEGKTAAGGVCS